jgi:hypothetical protein
MSRESCGKHGLSPEPPHLDGEFDFGWRSASSAALAPEALTLGILIARQWGKIPVNFRKPVAVDPSAYKGYVGHYVWRPLDVVESVSVKDGRLWTQSGNDVQEYLPLGADAFFLKSELGINTFRRDVQGHVTGYTDQDTDGQEVQVKKVK